MRNCNCGLSARELREIGEHHGEQIRHNDIRLMQQIDALRLQENEELEEAFRIANINRLELAESLVNYAKYLKAKMERERIKDEEEGIIIFINPGDEKPVLGQLIVD